MNGDFPAALGRFALSRAGRDKGRYYMIVGTEGTEFVLLADGHHRPIKHPKRKKLKHLRLQPERDETIAAQLQGGQPIYDQHVRQAISAMLEGKAGHA